MATPSREIARFTIPGETAYFELPRFFYRPGYTVQFVGTLWPPSRSPVEVIVFQTAGHTPDPAWLDGQPWTGCQFRKKLYDDLDHVLSHFSDLFLDDDYNPRPATPQPAEDPAPNRNLNAGDEAQDHDIFADILDDIDAHELAPEEAERPPQNAEPDAEAVAAHSDHVADDHVADDLGFDFDLYLNDVPPPEYTVVDLTGDDDEPEEQEDVDMVDPARAAPVHELDRAVDMGDDFAGGVPHHPELHAEQARDAPEVQRAHEATNVQPHPEGLPSQPPRAALEAPPALADHVPFPDLPLAANPPPASPIDAPPASLPATQPRKPSKKARRKANAILASQRSVAVRRENPARRGFHFKGNKTKFRAKTEYEDKTTKERLKPRDGVRVGRR